MRLRKAGWSIIFNVGTGGDVMALPFALPVFEGYWPLERLSEIRHEYLNGFVHAMASKSPARSTICFNLHGILHAQFRETRCRGFSPNMKVRSGDQDLFAYHDPAVVCGEPRLHDEHGDVRLNPSAIFEVISPPTSDQSEKFRRYAAIESPRDCLLIAQDRPRVERFSRRTDGTWGRFELDGASAVLSFPPACRIALADLYQRGDLMCATLRAVSG